MPRALLLLCLLALVGCGCQSDPIVKPRAYDAPEKPAPEVDCKDGV